MVLHKYKKSINVILFEGKRCYKRILLSTKIKEILLAQFLDEHIFETQTSRVDLKLATVLYS